MAYEQELQVALSAVTKAAALCSQVQQQLVTPETIIKKDKSPVTVADLGSQAVICLELLAHYSTDSIVAEEDIDTLRDNDELAGRVHELVVAQSPRVSNKQMLEAIACGRRHADYTVRNRIRRAVGGRHCPDGL